MTIPILLNIWSKRVMSSFVLLAHYSRHSHIYNINYSQYLHKTVAWFPERNIASLPEAAISLDKFGKNYKVPASSKHF